jgi:cysteine desulfurase/selenocysteine lyase
MSGRSSNSELVAFDKSVELFPVRKQGVYLNACGINAAYAGAAAAGARYFKRHSELGILIFSDPEFVGLKAKFKSAFSQLIRVDAADVSLTKNYAEAACQIALGYPFVPGDEIISYCKEYPSNFWPWKQLEKKGVGLKLLPDCAPVSGLPNTTNPLGWSFDDLVRTITPRTKIIAISHVQFTSGFAAELPKLGALCKERAIDLVVDVAQSLGALPVYPKEWNVACVIASGWKWLMGPIGCGVMYTAPEFRAKIEAVLVGPDMMGQGDDYLNYTFDPLKSGAFFEYSTTSYPHTAALEAVLREVHLRYTPEQVRDELYRLQDLFLQNLTSERVKPVVFPQAHRSGILSLLCEDKPEAVQARLKAEKIICSVRGGYLRVAPHFFVTDDEMLRAAEVLNRVA